MIEIDEELLIKMSRVVNQSNLRGESEVARELIRELTECRGIGLPLASTVLKFLRPDVFPIIDIRAYRALFGKKIYQNQYTYDTYLKYCKRVYMIKETIGISLGEVDEQLYEFD